MSKNFRSEIFSLCNDLLTNDNSKQIAQLIHDYSADDKSQESGVGFLPNMRQNFMSVSKQMNTEFHAFLFVDDNAETLKLPSFMHIEHLTIDERLLIESGHKTLERLIELCLEDIKVESQTLAKALNPYSSYKEVNVSEQAPSILSDEELMPAVNAFKNGKIYKTLKNSNFIELFKKIDLNTLLSLFSVIDKEIKTSLAGDVSNDLRDFSLKLLNELQNITDVMFAYSILIYALRSSLRIACRLLYKSICGVELIVINNDNIINIEKNTSSLVSSFFKVYIQGALLDYTGGASGNVVLIDCDPFPKKHIHEFGFVFEETVTLCGDYGQTTKISFVTLNEELIHIHGLTNIILQHGIPTITKE